MDATRSALSTFSTVNFSQLPGQQTLCSRSSSTIPENIRAKITRWRLHRQKLQNQLCHTLSFPDVQPHQLSLEQLLGSLCNDLIDYVCAGHFCIYYHMPREANAEQKDEQHTLLHNIYQHIGKTTDQVLQFNAKFEKHHMGGYSVMLANDLKRLQRSLAMRFALEEQLLCLKGL